MASQRFCLRWNNHQTNLLSVFDQLLHAETFTDVTLAVEGQYLKAHKMVLSACSPYFQSLFTTHPEKHPIVILKDVPYADMKSLLDFMYRGEVSVDQERLTAFLKVAETLRIKGLTEVSDDNKQTFGSTPSSSSTPPPQLHRIHPYYVQQKQKQGMLLTNPLLGSALTMPKRKRGRPRKLSGSSNGTGDYDGYESNENGSPDVCEVKIGSELNSGNEASDDNVRENNNDESRQEPMDTSENNSKTSQPTSTPLKDTSPRKDHENSNKENNTSVDESVLLVPKIEPPEININYSLNNSLTTTSTTTAPTSIVKRTNYQTPAIIQQIQQLQQQQQQQQQIGSMSGASTKSTNFLNTAAQRIQSQTPQIDVINNNVETDNNTMFQSNQNLLSGTMPPPGISTLNSGTTIATTSNSSNNSSNSSNNTTTTTNTKPSVVRRRVRRKANSSSDDQTEQLTEMSVRGLNLFRYASICEGVYQCTECAKDNIQKTFKNKYSFQRHAFLYHEGTQRKVFPCPVCGKEFSRPDKMKNHMKTTHECYMPRDCSYPLNFIINPNKNEVLKIPKIENVMSKLENV